MSKNHGKQATSAKPVELADARTTREQIATAFNFGVKRTVTPRDGEPVELHIRPFYTEQALGIIDLLEEVFSMAKDLADAEGNLDLWALFKTGREKVLDLLSAAIEKDRAWLGRLEIDDLIAVFGDVFQQNKDFFAVRVKANLSQVIAQISTTLSNS